MCDVRLLLSFTCFLYSTQSMPGCWLGWGPLSHSNGCNLIHNQGFTHIIAITVSCSHRSDVCRITRKCRYLMVPLDIWTKVHTKVRNPCYVCENRWVICSFCTGSPPHTGTVVHCCRGRGNIQNHAFVPSWHLNDCWSWSLLECRALHCHWGGNYQGVKTGYFGHILSRSSTGALPVLVPVEQTPQLTDICR